jgi:hypothetical protein
VEGGSAAGRAGGEITGAELKFLITKDTELAIELLMACVGSKRYLQNQAFGTCNFASA